MKNFTFFFFMSLSLVVFPQTSTYKDNLFESEQISLEVTKVTNYYLLIIKNEKKTSRDSIYYWNLPLIENVLNKQFSDNAYKDKIPTEASRIFYEYKVQEIIMPSQSRQPVAGTMGFERNNVYLTTYRESASQYKNEIDKAFKLLRDQKKKKVIQDQNHKKDSEYSRFIIRQIKDLDTSLNSKSEQWRIMDKYLFPGSYYKKNKLIKIGAQVYQDSVKKNSIDVYNCKDSLKILNTRLRELNLKKDNLSNEEHELSVQLKYVISLNSSLSKKKEKTNQEDFNILLKDTIDSLQKKLTKIPDNQNISGLAIKSQISVLKGIQDNKKINDPIEQTQFMIDSIKGDASSLRMEINKTKHLQDSINSQQKKVQIDLNRITSKIKDSEYHIYPFNIDSIKIEITKTFIENMVLYGTVKYMDSLLKIPVEILQKYVVLRNAYPIGLSTLDILDYNNKKLNLYAIVNQKKCSVPLSEVLSFYRPELKSQRRDYSPADTSFTVIKNNSLQTITLKGESSSDLFEIKIFSDFIGIDGTSSNGLIQTEFSKEMYLNSNRRLIFQNQIRSAYFGFMSYIKPSFTLSKIEKTNKYYYLDYNNDTAYIPTLSLKEYEIYNVGFDVNTVLISLPFVKSNLYIDPGLYFGRTGISDSTYTYILHDSILSVNKRGINTWSFSTNLRAVVQTDERYFFEIGGFYRYTSMINNEIIQTSAVGNYTKANFCEKSLIGMEFFGGYVPNIKSNGRLFFRYRYTYSIGSKDGYNQLQLGYSYYFKK